MFRPDPDARMTPTPSPLPGPTQNNQMAVQIQGPMSLEAAALSQLGPERMLAALDRAAQVQERQLALEDTKLKNADACDQRLHKRKIRAMDHRDARDQRATSERLTSEAGLRKIATGILLIVAAFIVGCFCTGNIALGAGMLASLVSAVTGFFGGTGYERGKTRRSAKLMQGDG